MYLLYQGVCRKAQEDRDGEVEVDVKLNTEWDDECGDDMGGERG